ncbi:MAG: DNA modification methylase, partial [Candidatus Hodarchaeales archaeon]
KKTRKRTNRKGTDMKKAAAEYIAIEKLKPWDANPRQNENAIKQVADSIKRFGFGTPVLVRKEDNVIIAGHTRYEACKLLNIKELPVRYMDLDPVESRLLALADNKLNELADWDDDKLSTIIQDMKEEDLLNIGFSEEELNNLLGNLEEIPLEEDEELEEDTIQVQEEVHSKLGEIYELGPHLLICGDSTQTETYKRLLGTEKIDLVHADPPYGMGKENEGVLNDNLYNENLDSFLNSWISANFQFVNDSSSFYVWGNAYDLFRWYFTSKPIKEQKAYFRQEIVWNKNYGMGMKSDQHRMYPTVTERCLFFMLGIQEYNTNSDNYWEGWEPIRKYLYEERMKMGWDVPTMKRIVGHSEKSLDHWTTKSQWNMPTKKVYNAMREAAKNDAFKKEYDEIKKEYDEIKKEFMNSRSYFDNTHEIMTDVWDYERVKEEERHGHPTPKPVPMIKRIVKSSCRKNGIVLDPFGGSGPTLIAAAETGRKARIIELQPKFCDVIRRRWTNYAKQKNIKVGSGGLE